MLNAIRHVCTHTQKGSSWTQLGLYTQKGGEWRDTISHVHSHKMVGHNDVCIHTRKSKVVEHNEACRPTHSQRVMDHDKEKGAVT